MKRRHLALWSVVIMGILSALVFAINAYSRPHTIFDEAFELFDLTSLRQCAGYNEQRDIFLDNRGDLEPARPGEIEEIRLNWEEFLDSARGPNLRSCEETSPHYVGRYQSEPFQCVRTRHQLS